MITITIIMMMLIIIIVITCLNAMNSKCEASVRALCVILEHCVKVNLLDTINVTGEQRRDLLASTIY